MVGLGVNELSLALEAASNTYQALRDKAAEARAAGRQADVTRYQNAADEAYNLQRRARYRLQAGLVNPTGDKVRRLKDATKTLNDRLEALRNAQEDLDAITDGISILSDVIKLFGLR
jgi:small-conductance mechanosensitive channel